MINFIKKLFGGKPEAAPEVPYKVEAPVAKVEEVNAQPVEKAPEVKAPAKKALAKAGDPKPAKKPAKKPASK